MTCEKCGKAMVKIGELTEKEKNEYYYLNELGNTAFQALESNVIENIEFTDGQVYEYFKAAYEAMTNAKFLNYCFYKNLKQRFNTTKDIYIDGISCEVFEHPNK